MSSNDSTTDITNLLKVASTVGQRPSLQHCKQWYCQHTTFHAPQQHGHDAAARGEPYDAAAYDDAADVAPDAAAHDAATGRTGLWAAMGQASPMLQLRRERPDGARLSQDEQQA